jgi:Rod binding domain-containing protein
MNLSIMPASLMASPYSLEDKEFSVSDIQKSFLVNPTMGISSSGQSVSGAAAIGSLNSTESWHNLSSLSSPHHPDAQIKKVSQDFEGIFMRMMFKEMRNSVEKSKLFGNSNAMNIFESMRDDELADKISQAGGIGLGQIIYQRLQQATASHQKTIS